jgi:hypothetical protein
MAAWMYFRVEGRDKVFVAPGGAGDELYPRARAAAAAATRFDSAEGGAAMWVVGNPNVVLTADLPITLGGLQQFRGDPQLGTTAQAPILIQGAVSACSAGAGARACGRGAGLASGTPGAEARTILCGASKRQPQSAPPPPFRDASAARPRRGAQRADADGPGGGGGRRRGGVERQRGGVG